MTEAATVEDLVEGIEDIREAIVEGFASLGQGKAPVVNVAAPAVTVSPAAVQMPDRKPFKLVGRVTSRDADGNMLTFEVEVG